MTDKIIGEVARIHERFFDLIVERQLPDGH